MRRAQTLVWAALAATPGAALGQDFYLGTFVGSSIYDFEIDTSFANTVTGVRMVDENSEFLIGMDTDLAGDLWVLASGDNSAGHNLFKVDADTGDLITSYDTTIGGVEGDLAHRASTGEWWSWSESLFGDQRLSKYDPTTGTSTLVRFRDDSDTTFDDISGLSFDASGRLWAIDTNANNPDTSLRLAELIELDPTDGDLISRTSLGIEMSGVTGADFDPSTGLLWFIEPFGDMYSVDTSLGTATYVDTALGAPFHSISGLAVVPAPTSMLLLVGALGTRRRRRR